MNHESKRPVTVEDILRLKRAERPSAEFWASFDRALRAKQLAALVEQRPWWRSMPRVFAGFSRYSLPAGAAAVLAVTFLATRDFTPGQMAPASGTSSVNVVADTASAGSPVLSRAGVAAVEVAAAMAELPAGESPAAVEVPDVSAGSRALGVSHLISLLDEPAKPGEMSPSATYIAANLAASRGDDLAVSRNLLEPARGFESRAMPARAPSVDPLAQMTTPAAKSRARFATAMVTSYSAEPGARAASAKAARRIGDRVYDEQAIRRVGATGNSVALKF